MRTEPSFSTDSDHSLLDDVDHSYGGSASPFDAESQLLSDYRQRYGLSIDPFVDDPHFPFYTGALRRQILEQLLHLCQFSHNLLVVTGEYGVGKTRMAQALIDGLDDADDICFVEGQINSDIGSLLTEVCGQLELSDPLEFVDFCKSKTAQDGLVVLIVDNAHHLGSDVISDLINVLQENVESRLHLVLFAEPHFLSRLEHIDAPNLILTDFLLEKFSLDEAVDYLNFRMEMADYLGPEVFTEGDVEPWWRQSQGRLLSLHENAQEKLLASVSAPKRSISSKSSQIIPHIVATSVLLGGLLFGYFYIGRDSTPKAIDATVSAPVPIEPVIQAASSVQPVAQSKPVAVNAVSSDVSSVVKESTTYKSEELVDSGKVDATKSNVEPAVKQSVVPLVQTNSLEGSVAQKAAQMSSKPSSKESKKSELSSAPSLSQAKDLDSNSPRLSSALTEQEKAILAWSPSEFTLQLVGLSNEKSARDFIASQSNKKDLLLFRSKRAGKDWFVVVTGRFPTSAKARQAVQNLPPTQSQASPWPREIQVIQQEIRKR